MATLLVVRSLIEHHFVDYYCWLSLLLCVILVVCLLSLSFWEMLNNRHCFTLLSLQIYPATYIVHASWSTHSSLALAISVLFWFDWNTVGLLWTWLCLVLCLVLVPQKWPLFSTFLYIPSPPFGTHVQHSWLTPADTMMAVHWSVSYLTPVKSAS